MSDDGIAGLVAVGSLTVIALVFAFYWRQRFRFARGPDPVTFCSLRAWRGPFGLGWRQGFIRLGDDELSWRRRLSFRHTPYVTFARSSLRFVSRTRPDWQSWFWVSVCDVISLETPDRTLELALFPHDVDLVLDWLGTSAERPRPRLRPGLGIAIYVLFFIGIPVLYWSANRQPWLLPFIAIGPVALGVVGGVVIRSVRRRRLVSEALDDELVATAREVFSFLQDFGFDDVYVSRLPWRASLVATGKAGRFVAIAIDRRNERLDLEFGRPDDDKPSRLREILAEAGHPDPDRITRYTAGDGPLRAALEANAHALRLWGRPFLIADGKPAGSSV